MRTSSIQIGVLVGAATAALLGLHVPHAHGDEAAPELSSDSADDSLQVLWEIDTGG